YAPQGESPLLLSDLSSRGGRCVRPRTRPRLVPVAFARRRDRTGCHAMSGSDGRNLDRRHFALATVGSLVAFFPTVRPATARNAAPQKYVAEAARMKREAVANGDQPFGAVVVMDDTIVGYGPSRVVSDRNPDAHAERVALWDAQRRLG